MLKLKKIGVLLTALTLSLIGCAGSNGTESGEVETSEKIEANISESAQIESESGKEVSEEELKESDSGAIKIKDASGEVEVPLNPQRVISLDNRTFETLDAWGIELVAGPKALMPQDLAMAKDEDSLDIGNHKEPNFENIAAANPDLIIIGQRFASHVDTIREIAPGAAIIDLNFDVSESAASPGVNLVDGLKNSTQSLGKIFDKEDEAKDLIEELDRSIEEVKESYNPDETVMAVVVSGGEIGFSAPRTGRVWGPLYEIVDLTPALEVEGASSDHQGDDISVEAIAESNPNWILVLDRDAGANQGDNSNPAADVISGSPALAETDAIKNNKVIYAPNDTYINESIQTFIEIFKNLGSSFKG